MPNSRGMYLIERIHHSRICHDRWEKVGEFVAGSPWRDGRLVNDETMLEEVQGYRWSWPGFFARVRRPDGSVFETLQDLKYIETPNAMLRWVCIGHNPTVWALGAPGDRELHGIRAIVTRARSCWHWISAWHAASGMEPSRETAMDAVEVHLEKESSKRKKDLATLGSADKHGPVTLRSEDS